MEAGFIAITILSMVLGIIIGMFVGRSRVNRRGTKGNLNVVYCDSENEPGLWLQLQVPIEDVISQKQATFNVRIIQR